MFLYSWVRMFMKSFALSLSLFLLLSTSCLAEVVKVRTDEPASKHLGMKIDIAGRNFVDSFPVASDKFLSIDKNLTDVRIRKGKVGGLNKFSALVAYRLHVKNAEPSATRFLYVQCPVTRETYIDRSPPPKEIMINGEMRWSLPIDHKVLNKEFLYLGSYSFLSSPEDRVPRLSKDFPMAGKVNEFILIEAMCLDIRVVYSEYNWAESFRFMSLKNHGISE